MSRAKATPNTDQQPAARPLRRRAPRRSFTDEVIRDLSTVTESDDNRATLTALCDNLALWARYMMELNPSNAAHFYRACIESWKDNDIAAQLYEMRDPRETDGFHGAFIKAYRQIFKLNEGATDKAETQGDKIIRAMHLFQMQRQLAGMAARLGTSIQAPAEMNLGAREQRTITLGRGWNRETSFGLHQGDEIEYVEAKPEELRKGDFIGIYNMKERSWNGVGYFEGADALSFDVMNSDGSCEFSLHNGYVIHLILSVKHAEHFERPKKGAETAILNGSTAAKISRLKKRLDRLGDDITDSTERFKIEREIYELEREAAVDDGEWPDTIDA